MRIVALVEALVVLLAAVTAYGPSALPVSVCSGVPGAPTDNPACRLEHTPAHPLSLGDQITRKEGFLSEQSTKPCKITAVGAALGVKADPSCVHQTEPSAAISAVVQRPSLLSLCCLLIV